MENIKIIVADDEALLRELVHDYLKKSGYEVLCADDGTTALQLFEANPDTALIILDVMMPELDGWATCRKIREFSDVPVIMLTARSEEFDQLMGFEAGADDYVTKPFSPAILEKRVEAILRRRNGEQAAEQPKGRLAIDGDAYTATLDGVQLELTVKEFEILRLLNDNVGRVFTRTQLLDAIWNYDYEGDARTVDSHMARLRVKLGDFGNTHLKTVYGIGYKLEL